MVRHLTSLFYVSLRDRGGWVYLRDQAFKMNSIAATCTVISPGLWAYLLLACCAANPTWTILGSGVFECKRMGMVFVLNSAWKRKTSGVHIEVAANAFVKIVAARFTAGITWDLIIYFFEESKEVIVLLMFQWRCKTKAYQVEVKPTYVAVVHKTTDPLPTGTTDYFWARIRRFFKEFEGVRRVERMFVLLWQLSTRFVECVLIAFLQQ